MEKLLTQSLISDEFFSENIGVTPVEWQSIDSPFCVTEVVDINSQNWATSETQLDSRPTHHTYKTASGRDVHWKAADDIFEPFYEGVAYELGISAGASFPYTAPAYIVSSDGSLVLGVVSFALFSTTIADLSDYGKQILFTNVNKTMFIGESVLAVWWRNFDWSNKFDSVAIGCQNGSKNKLSYYPFDHSHIYRGPSGKMDLIELEKYNISYNFWQRKYVNFGFAECEPFVEKIENMSDEKIKTSCVGWATKIGNVDISNKDNYFKMASEFAGFLLRSKKLLRRELELFFQGVNFAS